jgi:hypothetical protein
MKMLTFLTVSTVLKLVGIVSAPVQISDEFSTVKSGGVIELPDGETILTAPLKLSEVDKVTIKGKGSRLLYRGHPTPAVLTLARCGHCVVEGVEIVVDAPGVDSAVLVTNLPGTSPVGRISTANRFVDVSVSHRGQPHSPKKAFSVDCRTLGGADANNEFHSFTRCSASTYLDAGFYCWGSQAHQLQFDGCSASDVLSRGKYALWCEHGIFFRWVNGNAARNKVDFQLGTMHFRAVIDGHNSEISDRLLWLGTSGNSAPLTIKNVRWDGYPARSSEPTIWAWTRGHVRIEDCVFTSAGGTADDDRGVPRIEINCYQDRRGVRQSGFATVRGNTFQVRTNTGNAWNIRVPAAWTASDVNGNLALQYTGSAPFLDAPAKVERTR